MRANLLGLLFVGGCVSGEIGAALVPDEATTDAAPAPDEPDASAADELDAAGEPEPEPQPEPAPEPEPEPPCGEGADPDLFVWPMPRTLAAGQRFGNPIDYQTCGFHTGVDVGASIGDPVLSMAAGVVVHVGPMWLDGAGQGRGPNAVIVQHAPQFYSTYSHNDAALVAVGDCVEAGTQIAEAGDLGYSFGPHLHWEVVRGTDFTGDWQVPFEDACSHYEDPLDYVSP